MGPMKGNGIRFMGAFLAFFAVATLAGSWLMLASARTRGIADGVAGVMASRAQPVLAQPVRLGPYMVSAAPMPGTVPAEVRVEVRDRRTGMLMASATASLAAGER